MAILALAPAVRVAIVPAVTGEGALAPRVVHDAVARALAARHAVELLPYDALLVGGPDSTSRGVVACGTDARCIAFHLQSAQVDLALRVGLSFDVRPPIAALLLVDAKQRKIAQQAIVEVDGRVPLADLLENAAASLLDAAGIERGGHVELAVTPSTAKVVVERNGTVVAEGSGPFVLPPGRYDLRARHEGYVEGRQGLELSVGDRERVVLELAAERSLTESPWLWVGVAAAVVASAVIVVVATDPFATDPTCYCVAEPGRPCPPC